MLILTNATIIASNEIIRGTLAAAGGKISCIDEGLTSSGNVVDCEGDFLIPGLIDLHTDALQQHTAPRAGVQWPVDAAVVAHDAQVATAGITTVFDAQSIGVGVTAEEEDGFLERLRGSLAELNWQEDSRWCP